jgi:hypothetical protein
MLAHRDMIRGRRRTIEKSLEGSRLGQCMEHDTGSVGRRQSDKSRNVLELSRCLVKLQGFSRVFLLEYFESL